MSLARKAKRKANKEQMHKDKIFELHTITYHYKLAMVKKYGNASNQHHYG